MKQLCPICKRYVKSSSRYPYYLCGKCVLQLTDKQGTCVEFFNTDFSGHGCVGRYRDSKEEYRFSICYVENKVCRAEEGYYGGIMISLIIFSFNT